MRFLIYTVIAVALTVAAGAQNGPPSPPWPDIPLVSCPAIGPSPSDQSQRTWKHGQLERDSFNASVGALQAKNYSGAAEQFAKFAEEYSDSDYREAAIFYEMLAQSYLKNKPGLVQAAAKMIRLPAASAASQETAFVTLSDALSPYVGSDDPRKEEKLADLEKWTRCGEEAMAANIRPANMPQDAFDKHHNTSESVLDRTAGFVAYMRHDYVLANTKLEAASKDDPQGALTCVLLALDKFFLPEPDPNSGIFYLARWADLAPKGYWAAPDVGEKSAAFLKQMYVIVHGSDKGLSALTKLAKSNTVPPPGFNVLPKPKTKHHYGSGIAATAIVGLLVYGLATHPDLMGEIGRSFAASVTPTTQKLMVFGGPGHGVYLGCLSCSEVEADSVFNPIGAHGSKVSSESIWNVVGQYGSQVSPYSACNALASDPPVIVDQDGNAYGRLTMNRVDARIGLGARFYNWLASDVCQN